MPSVLELDLSLNPLRNADLSQLPKHLTLLNLSHCDLQVENLEKLLLKLPSSLATLDLSSNQIGGTIPDFSQLFPVLSHFDVGNNSVQGSFSPAVFPPSIQVLNLGANQLKGAVNELSALVELQVLNLSHNQFVSLDTKELPNLLELDISHNAMEDLDLMRIMKLRDLTTFAASHNKLKGTIDLTMIPTGLQVLDLSDNQLSGTLDFTHFTDAIRFVFLHNNHFTGSLDLMDLPVDLRRLTFWGNDFPLELPPDPSGAKTPEL
jgi:Leucine-rich repeat (LRR) protein